MVCAPLNGWNGLLPGNEGGFSREGHVMLAVLTTECQNVRDALLFAALREMNGSELHMVDVRPHSH